MTDYTELNVQQLESLKIHLAEKVMGWDISSVFGSDLIGEPLEPELIYCDKQCIVIMKVSDFDPPNNIEQAMGCFVMLGIDYRIELLSDADCKFCTLTKRSRHLALDRTPMGFRTTGFWHGKGKEYEVAISLACAKATGWEE